MSSAGPKAQTLDDYKKLLIDVYRKIVDAENDYSRITTFSEKGIATLLSFDYLQNVRQELGLSDDSKRFDGIQAKHIRMAALLFELTESYFDASSAQLKSHLTELLSCITNLWNTIQFLVHCRDTERSLMPKGFQNYEKNRYFNSVLQCLLQTVFLPFELTVTIYGLGNVLTEKEEMYRLSKAFVELVSKYNESEHRKGALQTLHSTFTTAASDQRDQSQLGAHDLLLYFLDKLRVEERNAWKIPSAGPESQKMMTAIDRNFGGQFITVYTCHSCEEHFAKRKPFLDISIPLSSSIADEQKPKEKKSKTNTRSKFQKIDALKSISVRHDTSDARIRLGTLGTPNSVSQQRTQADVGNDVESSSSAFDEVRKASTIKEAIKTMLQPIVVEESAKPETKNRLFRAFKTSYKNVNQCLRYVTRTEVIDSKDLCRYCQTQESDEPKTTSATKRTLISSPPAVLVLHLERFEQKPTGFAKRDEMISYDELLDLGPFCSCSALRIDPEEENVWYSLYAVVVHCDVSIPKGQYKAYVKYRDSSALLDDQLSDKFLQKNMGEHDKVPNDDDLAAMEKRKAIKRREKAKRPDPIPGQWFRIRDDSVRSCDAEKALDQKASLLFYERIPGTNQKTIGV